MVKTFRNEANRLSFKRLDLEKWCIFIEAQIITEVAKTIRYEKETPD